MNYEELSDFDINKLVAKNLGLVSPSVPDGKKSVIWVHNGNPMRGDKDVDYCNVPNDSWPIIMENKISISFRDDKLQPTAKQYQTPENTVTGANPLRACMIVFLKLKSE